MSNRCRWPRAVPGIICFLLLLTPSISSATNASVSIGSFFFSPSDVTINVGDTVTWNWVGGGHSTTSDSGFWDSSVMSSGSFQMQFGNSGSFPYHCTPHSSFMRGSISVSGGNQPPSVGITSPANNTVFIAGPTNVAVHASASDTDGTIATIQLFLDNAPIATVAASSYDNSLTNIAPGNHTLTAITTDNDGATGTNSLAFIVNRPPSASISFPADNSVFSQGASISMQASGSDLDGSISQLQLLVNGVVVTNGTSSPLSFTIANATNGTYVLTARATDNRGAITTSQAITTIATSINLLSAHQSGNQPFQFSLSGLVAGKTNIIQSSTNLNSAASWIPIRTNVAVAGSTNFIDIGSPLPGAHFYRAIQLP